MDNAGQHHVRRLSPAHGAGTRPRSPARLYNDGQWHHVVASSAAAACSCTSTQAGRADAASHHAVRPTRATGGSAATTSAAWPNQPSSINFNGSIDEVAIYPTPLTAAQVANHYIASGRTPPAWPRPTDTYGAAVYDASRTSTGGSTRPPARSRTTSRRTATTAPTRWRHARHPRRHHRHDRHRRHLQRLERRAVVEQRAVHQPDALQRGGVVQDHHDHRRQDHRLRQPQTGNVGSYDRHVYMLNNGSCLRRLDRRQPTPSPAPTSYNDGQWHQWSPPRPATA